MKIPRPGLLFWSIVFGVAAAGAAAGVISNRPPAVPPSVAQIQDLLPAGSVLHSLARLEMNGRPPQEVALVVGVPVFPGTGKYAYYGFIYGRDPWRRRITRAYAEALPGPLPLSVDAGRLLGSREAAVFGAAHDDGGASFRVVGLRRSAPSVVYETQTVGRLIVVNDLLIEVVKRPDAPPDQRIFAWNGRRFQERPDIAPIHLPPAGRTWYYGVRNRSITAPVSMIRLSVRQPLRVSGTGPGRPGAIVIADQGLDQVESGYRARRSGTYRIRFLLPFSAQSNFVLTVIVEDTP